jgi:hypothetical protein
MQSLNLLAITNRLVEETMVDQRRDGLTKHMEPEHTELPPQKCTKSWKKQKNNEWQCFRVIAMFYFAERHQIIWAWRAITPPLPTPALRRPIWTVSVRHLWSYLSVHRIILRWIPDGLWGSEVDLCLRMCPAVFLGTVCCDGRRLSAVSPDVSRYGAN